MTDDWQPMDTAPKDKHVDILTATWVPRTKGWIIEVVYWEPAFCAWRGDGAETHTVHPDLWKPITLPAPPAQPPTTGETNDD